MTHFLSALVLLAVLVMTSRAMADGPAAQTPPDYWVYVGNFGNKGIALFKLDSAKGTLTAAGVAAQENDPNFLAVHPNGKVLYSVASKGKDGAVDAFSIDAATGKLTKINQQSTGGANAVYVSVDPSGKSAFVANYDGPSVASFALKADGSLGEAQVSPHSGSSVDPGRQKRPYPHSILPDPAGKFVFSPDLGCDKIFSYKLDAATGKLTANDPAAFSVPAGAGPRHMAFAPNGKFAYIVTEMGQEVISCSYDAAAGTLKQIDRITIKPQGAGWTSGAEIKVHPNGKFVYASVRGANKIAVYAIDQSTGKLTHIEHADLKVKTPRGFGIDPTGSFLIAGGQDSGEIELFKIDSASGKLTSAGTTKAATPVTIAFVPVAK